MALFERAKSAVEQLEKPASFEIQLNNPSRTYFFGHQVAGAVCITLRSPMAAERLTLELVGEAHLSRKVDGVDHEKKLAAVAPIVVWPGGGKLPAGQNSFPFVLETSQLVTVPPLPASFEGAFGAVRYELRAMLKRSMLLPDHKVATAVSLVPIIDADAPDHAAPVTRSTEHNIPRSLTSWSGGKIAGSISLRRTSFLPGDAIPVHIDIQNGSKKQQITEANLSIVQTSTFRWGSSKQNQVRAIVKNQVLERHVPPGDNASFDRQISLPVVTPAFTSEMVSISYTIMLEVGVPEVLLTVEVPFVVGTLRCPPQAPAFNPAAVSMYQPAPMPMPAEVYAPTYNEPLPQQMQPQPQSQSPVPGQAPLYPVLPGNPPAFAPQPPMPQQPQQMAPAPYYPGGAPCYAPGAQAPPPAYAPGYAPGGYAPGYDPQQQQQQQPPNYYQNGCSAPAPACEAPLK